MAEFDLNRPYFRIQAFCGEEMFPLLLDISNFVYDLNLIYELSRLAVDPKYSGFKFSGNATYRRGRPILDDDRLRVEQISYKSPIALVLLLTISGGGALAGVWTFIQILEKVSNFQLNRRKLKAEVEKLERENRTAGIEGANKILENPEAFHEILRHREAEYYLDAAGKRLSNSPVKIRELEIEIRR